MRTVTKVKIIFFAKREICYLSSAIKTWRFWKLLTSLEQLSVIECIIYLAWDQLQNAPICRKKAHACADKKFSFVLINYRWYCIRRFLTSAILVWDVHILCKLLIVQSIFGELCCMMGVGDTTGFSTCCSISYQFQPTVKNSFKCCLGNYTFLRPCLTMLGVAIKVLPITPARYKKCCWISHSLKCSFFIAT